MDQPHGVARYDAATITLTIRRVLARSKGRPIIVEADYRVLQLDPHPDIGAPAMRLTKTDGEFYDIIRTKFGYECSCPDGNYRRQNTPTTCKHVRGLQAVGLLPPGR